jgi:hypothetical protein
MTSDLVARLAAANPVPTGVPLHKPHRAPINPRRLSIGLALATAVAVPALAFADDIGALLGISNQGTPVASSTLPFAQYTKLAEAMQELGNPSTMHLLATRNGISFYAAQRPDGHYCFAIDSSDGRGFGCDGGPSLFPSEEKPILAFPPHAQLAGFAADGVSAVEAVDANGVTLVSVPVSDNVFAGGATPAGAVELRVLDASGNVIRTLPLQQP